MAINPIKTQITDFFKKKYCVGSLNSESLLVVEFHFAAQLTCKNRDHIV